MIVKLLQIQINSNQKNMKKLFYTFVLTCFATCLCLAADAKHNPNLQIVLSDSVALSEYAGKYKFVGLPFDYMEITLKEGVLTVDAGGQGGPMTQDKESQDKFDVLGEAIFKFVRNEEKKIVKLVVEYQGMTLNGEKEK